MKKRTCGRSPAMNLKVRLPMKRQTPGRLISPWKPSRNENPSGRRFHQLKYIQDKNVKDALIIDFRKLIDPTEEMINIIRLLSG